MTFYRLILLIDIFICLVVTAVCLFFIKVLQQQQQQNSDSCLFLCVCYTTVKTVLNVRLSESDSKLVSILELPGDVLIVPQATLGGRVKGRSMQYHGNIDKQTGSQLYEQFVNRCREAVQQTTKQCTVHCGTYGIRQVLSMVTNGPYSHVVDI